MLLTKNYENLYMSLSCRHASQFADEVQFKCLLLILTHNRLSSSQTVLNSDIYKCKLLVHLDANMTSKNK